ncbi:MAG: hypothetical protein IT240_04535 [Bacteroidia bacterium]|nr:hypothetical protein [Bacteroidia bacterium]
MIIQLLLFAFWLTIFLVLAGKLNFLSKSGIRPAFLRGMLLLKVAAGIVLTLIYTHHYPDRQTADVYKYFDDALVIHGTFNNDPLVYFSLVSGVEIPGHPAEPAIREMKNWTPLSGPWLRFTQTADYNVFNSNRMVTRINALLMPFSQKYIYTHVLFFCFFSLLGSVALYRQVRNRVHGREVITALLIFLLPSVILWSSGPLKDGLLLATLNLFTWKLFSLTTKQTSARRLGTILVLILLAGLILLTKYYVLLAASPAIVAFAWCRFKKQNHYAALVYLAVPAIFLMLLIIQSEMLPALPNIWNVLANKREEALKLAIWADANHQVFTEPVGTGILPVVAKLPEALFNSLFRPHLFEADGAFLYAAAIENVLIMSLLILFLRKISWSNLLEEQSLFFWSFSLCLAFIIGFTTPVTGGLVRYKTAFIIYLLLAALMSGQYTGLQRWKNLVNQNNHG